MRKKLWKGLAFLKVQGKTLLFIENDPAAREEIMSHFAADNTVMIADCIYRAEECLLLFTYDLIVADADFPDGPPFLLYERYESLPPLILYTFSHDDEAIIDWLRRGAIDYVIRPASIKLLEAKMSLRLKERAELEAKTQGIRITESTRQASFEGTSVTLTSSEFNILKFLMNNPDVFFSSDEIYERIWNARAFNTVTVRKHISSLRRKLLSATGGRDFILTDFGKGYCYSEK